MFCGFYFVINICFYCQNVMIGGVFCVILIHYICSIYNICFCNIILNFFHNLFYFPNLLSIFAFQLTTIS